MANAVLVKAVGFERLKGKLNKLPKSVTNAVNKRVNKGAREMRTAIRASIKQSSGQWNFYEPDHWSSPPGTPPNNDTGRLMMSVIVQQATLKRIMHASVIVDAPYAMALEYGTLTIEPRPFVAPVFKEMVPTVHQDIKNAINAATAALRGG